MSDRPSANDAFGELNGTRLLLTAWCRGCSERIGVVMQTTHGPLWFGFLHNPENSQMRQSFGIGREDKGHNGIPIWFDRGRPNYIGECRCPRNSAPGEPLWAAFDAGRKKVDVGPQS